MIAQPQRSSVAGLGHRLAEEYAGRRELNRLRKDSLPAGSREQHSVGTTASGELAYLDLDRWASDGAASVNAAVVGARGAGKSTALYRAMIECAAQGVPGVFVALRGEAPEGMPKVRLSDLSSLPLLSALGEGYERLNERLVTEFLVEALEVSERWPHGPLISAAVRENISERAPSERSVRYLLDFFHRQGRDVGASTAHQQAARECLEKLGYLMDLPETEQLFSDVPSDLRLKGGSDLVCAIEFDGLQLPLAAVSDSIGGGVGPGKGSIGNFTLSEGERVSLAALPLLVAHCYSLALGKRVGHAHGLGGSDRNTAHPRAILALDDADLLLRVRRGTGTAEAMLADGREQGVSVWMSAGRWRSLEPLSAYLPTRLIGAPGPVYTFASDGEIPLSLVAADEEIPLVALFAAGVRPHTPVIKKLQSLRTGEFIYSSRGPNHADKRGIIRFFAPLSSRNAVDGGDQSPRPATAFSAPTAASDAAQ